MTELTQNSQKYYTLFNELKATIDKGSVEAINKHRQSAIEHFRDLGGFPTTSVENYKYTDLDSIFEDKYAINDGAIAFDLEIEKSEIIPVDDAYSIYFRNGYLEEGKDAQALREQGVVICSLQEAVKKHTALFDEYYNKKADKSEHSIVSLNTAFIQDGLFIYVPENVSVDKPIQLVNLLCSKEDLVVNIRNLLIVDKNAKVQFLDCTHALSCNLFLSNTVVELFAKENSKVEYYALHNQFNKSIVFTNLFVGQKRDSEVVSNILSLNTQNIRNNVTVDLEEENCHNHTYGLYLAGGEEHVDNFTAINHIAPHCNSWEHFKGILDAKAITAFCGRIHVYKDAQKTQAYQTNNNLVLSNEAKANTKPQLIIEADDVSCSHGATVGQLDDQAIYYLRARGIPYDEAYRMMMSAFMNEITGKIEIPQLRERIESWIADKMAGKIIYYDACCPKKR